MPERQVLLRVAGVVGDMVRMIVLGQEPSEPISIPLSDIPEDLRVHLPIPGFGGRTYFLAQANDTHAEKDGNLKLHNFRMGPDPVHEEHLENEPLTRELLAAELELPELLQNEAAWKSLFINYHPPIVERLWIPYDDEYRLSLHRIHPCSGSDALFHPHPWPSAMKVIEGQYEMGVGYGVGDNPPPVAARITMVEDSMYEMSHPNAWHYVQPLHLPVYTIMITGRPWKRSSPEPGKKLTELSAKQKEDLFNVFRFHYPPK